MDKKEKTTVYISMLTSFVSTFMGSALSISIPYMEKYFDSDARKTGMVITVYMFTCAVLAIPFGRLADRCGKITVLRAGTVIFCLMSAMASFSEELRVLLYLRAGQGIGAAMIFSTNIAILSDVFEEDRLGKALGYSTCATYAGLSAGPLLGGILNYHFGWQSIFIVAAAASALSAFGVFFMLKKPDTDIAETSGFIKTLKSLSGNRKFVLSNLAAMINYGSSFAVTYMLSLYLQIAKEMTSQTAGFVLVINTLVMSVFSVAAGRLMAAVCPEKLSDIGMAVCAAGTFAFIFITERTSVPVIIIILILLGAGMAWFSSPNTKVIMSSVEECDYSMASSVLSAMRSCGHTLSMIITSLSMRIYMDGTNINSAEPELLMKTFHMTFIIFSVLCIIGIFMAVKRKM